MNSAGCGILAVEDDPEWTDLIRLWLATGGYTELRFAATAAQGLRAIKTQVPDCVILDFELPDLDGLSLARKIREFPGAREVPLLMFTNHKGLKVDAIERAADHFVPKGPDGTELLATLQAVFRRRDLDAGLRRIGDLAFRPERCEVYLRGALVATLTPKTQQLFWTLVERSPAPVHRDEFSSLVDFREDPSISRALDLLINRLRKALPEEISRRIRAVKGFGYVYAPPPLPKSS